MPCCSDDTLVAPVGVAAMAPPASATQDASTSVLKMLLIMT
jgi:hypothetical protein